MIKTKTTTKKYLIKGIKTSTPSVANVLANNANTATGVNCIIIITILLKTLFKLSINSINTGTSFFT